jgi:hypothetical protein
LEERTPDPEKIGELIEVAMKAEIGDIFLDVSASEFVLYEVSVRDGKVSHEGENRPKKFRTSAQLRPEEALRVPRNANYRFSCQ